MSEKFKDVNGVKVSYEDGFCLVACRSYHKILEKRNALRNVPAELHEFLLAYVHAEPYESALVKATLSHM